MERVVKIAVAGKGGAGKTTIAGTLARVLARDGLSVIAIDADAGPNLGLALGVAADDVGRLPVLPRDLLADGALTQPVHTILRAHGTPTPDGVELLVMARPERADTGCLSDLQAIVRGIVAAAPGGDARACVLDTDAAPESFSRGLARHVDTMLLAVEAFPASLETGRRMARLAQDLGIGRIAFVASKVRGAEDAALVRAAADDVGLAVAAEIPYDGLLGEAERTARAPLDAVPHGPAVAAITELAGSPYVRDAPTGRVATG